MTNKTVHRFIKAETSQLRKLLFKKHTELKRYLLNKKLSPKDLDLLKVDGTINLMLLNRYRIQQQECYPSRVKEKPLQQLITDKKYETLFD